VRHPILDLASHDRLKEFAAAVGDGHRVVARGVSGSSTHLLAGAIARLCARPVLLVVAHVDEADEAADELSAAGESARRLPALEGLPGDAGGASLDLFAERLGVVRHLSGLAGPHVVVAPIAALMQTVPPPEVAAAMVRELRVGCDIDLAELVRWLAASGYERVDAVEEPGDFALRGGILDVFPPGRGVGAAPVRFDFFGDTIDSISEIDLATMGSDRTLRDIELVTANAARVGTEAGAGTESRTSPMRNARESAGDRSGEWVGAAIHSLLPPGTVVMISETSEVVEQGRGYYERVIDSRGVLGPPAVFAGLTEHSHAMAEVNRLNAVAARGDTPVELPLGNLAPFSKDLAQACAQLGELCTKGRVVVCAQNAGELQRFRELGEQHRLPRTIDAVEAYVHEGFVWDEGGPDPLTVVPYHELINRFAVHRRGAAIAAGRAMDTFLDLAVGDFVVHSAHGIAQLVGLVLMKPRDLPGRHDDVPGVPAALAKPRIKEPEEQEYLVLEFANKSKLYVPATQIDQVQKYIGGFKGKPQLSTLGGTRWQSQKDRVEESVKDLAAELLRVRAAREHLPGFAFPADTPWQVEFEEEFPYEETQDQLSALASIKSDMHKPKPMDRLVCGDVGFGKTELAIRAAFKCAESGRQVAVLVPTTVLAEQHERTFRARFAGYPFRVESISRFKEQREVRDILGAARTGGVDILIGTHRVLSQDVVFKDLGLVIVDEEQRFGVEHKDRLLRFRLTADVLTLSATPIPRTLHMSLLGIRDISNLTTPPADRRAIVTEVIPYNERRIKQAIERELSREGQIFYVHNRVHNIREVADRVAKLSPPGTRIVYGHGQMDGDELEEVMLRFIRGNADILVSTTIIESGIDIARANTMIIADADRLGLSELHQLRGRVGRGKHRAYCYMLMPDDRPLTEKARKRLEAIEKFSMLGAGFKIAMRDLEIRGAGNILGPEQSGHIAAVGYEMYCQLLEQAVRGLRNEPSTPRAGSTSVEIGITGTIPRAYIPSDARRLLAYRRLAEAQGVEELERARADMIDAYGDPPRPTIRLFLLAELRIACAGLGVRTVTRRDQDVVFVTQKAKRLADVLGKAPATVSGRPIEARISVVPSTTSDTHAEVYFRPPEKYLEPETLLAVLRKRLCPTVNPAGSPLAGSG